MELFILTAGFVGAWFLFAGPVYQAALELGEENFERDRIREIAGRVTTSQHVSSWWWVLPPVKFILEHKQSKKFREEYLSLLTSEDIENFVSFTSKARGWLIVSFGALMIALKETYELVEHLELSMWVYFVTIIVLFFVSVGFTVIAHRRKKLILIKRT